MSFTVYRSSAGSGKTYTLVKEYLKIVLSDKTDNRYKNILAITFTNKAAAEMKSRVMDALSSISGEEKPEGTPFYLLKDLVLELELDEAVIRQKCAAVLTSMLHNYSDISISTIDKFVHKIVRNFAYDLQIPLNFSVEMDSESMLQTAIDLLISKVGSDENLTQALVAFSERKAEEEKSWNIGQDLKNFAFDLLKEQNSEYLEKLKNLTLQDFFTIRNELEKFTAHFENELKKIGEAALKLISENAIAHKDFAGAEKGGIAKYFSYLFEKRNEKFEPTPTLQKYVAEDTWAAGKATAQARNTISNCKAELKNLFESAQRILERDNKNYILLSAVQRNIYALSVLNEIEKVISAIKKENNQLHISEFSKKIAAIVMNEPVPFIYERLGEKYKNFLIDEFQDTSLMQWQNFIPLLENSLATGEFNMLVGDGKQAIYRWRGGEVEQFTNLPKIALAENNPLILEREDALVRNFNEKFLDHNRRSKREITEFNNDFFRFIVEQEKFPAFLKPIYTKLEQGFDPGNTGGYVHFHFLNSKAEEFEAHRNTCEQVLFTIKNLQADNYRLSDIAILTRNNKNGVVLSKFLIEAGINVVSKESLLLSSSASVNFVVSVLTYLNNTQDAIAKASMMEYLLKAGSSSAAPSLNFYFKEEDFFQKHLNQNYPGWSKARLLQFPLYELCEEITRVFQLNKPADPYLVFFLDAVYSYISKNNNSIADFMEWWERKKNLLSIVIPDGLNAVQVLTIHKSKGLEFPVVIFPYANWKQIASGENLWVNLKNEKIPQLPAALLPLSGTLEKTEFAREYLIERSKKELDDLNVLYVAFTRAVNRLYVICEPPDQWKNLAKYYVDFLKHRELWQEEQQEYSFGELQRKPEKEKEKPRLKVEFLEEVVSGDWRSKISLSNQAEKMWNPENSSADKDYGNLIHTALARVLTRNDIDASINSMLAEGLLIPEEQEFLKHKLEGLIFRKEILPFFEDGLDIKAEAEILLSQGKSYRPDRVVFYPEKAVILDYKTGVELEKHKTQISNYASSLSQMGYPRVEKYLLYTETEKLVIV